jgi:Putative MetA-pathway of phenol degradation
MCWFMSRGVLAAATACSLVAIPASAEDEDPRPAAGIQDNSFLIEEAYNQKPGEVQFVKTLRRQQRDWHLDFETEWALGSQDHQFSFGVPHSWIRNDEGQTVKGFGDLMLNYRYQFWHESATMPAFAPRLSLILPTGSRTKGTGDESFGLETNLPFSKIVSDRVTLHANAGLAHLFDVDGQSPTSYKLGGSAIYAVTRDFNWMLEVVGEWEETVNDLREIERQFTFTINPGFRTAINFRDESQLVVGFSVPIGLSKGNAPDYGLFFYLSYEHDFLPKNKK